MSTDFSINGEVFATRSATGHGFSIVNMEVTESEWEAMRDQRGMVFGDNGEQHMSCRAWMMEMSHVEFMSSARMMRRLQFARGHRFSIVRAETASVRARMMDVVRQENS